MKNWAKLAWLAGILHIGCQSNIQDGDLSVVPSSGPDVKPTICPFYGVKNLEAPDAPWPAETPCTEDGFVASAVKVQAMWFPRLSGNSGLPFSNDAIMPKARWNIADMPAGLGGQWIVKSRCSAGSCTDRGNGNGILISKDSNGTVRATIELPCNTTTDQVFAPTANAEQIELIPGDWGCSVAIRRQ